MSAQPNPSVLRGIAALVDALDLIGDVEKTDHDMAKIIVDASGDLAALASFALAAQAQQP